MNVVTQFIKNTVYQSFNDFFIRILSAAAGIVIIRFLSKDDYGILAIILAVVGFINLISNLGYPTMVVKSISKYYQSDVAKAGAYYRFSFKIYGLITFVFTLLLVFAAPFIAKAYGLPEITNLIRLSAAIFLLTSVFSFYNWVFVGLNQIKPFFLKIGIPKEILTFTFIIGFLLLGMSIKGVLYAQIAGLFIGVVLAWMAVIAKFKREETIIDKKWIVRGALEITPGSIASASIKYMDVLIIGAVLTSSLLASYRVCLAVVQMVVAFFPVGVFILPTFHQLEKEKANVLLNDILTITILISLPVTAFIATFSKEIITVLFGTRYLDSALLLSLFSIAIAAWFIKMIFVGAMSYLGRFKMLSTIWISVGFINILALILFTKLMGLIGALIVTVSIYYLLALLMGWDVNRHGMKIKPAMLIEIVILGVPLLINFVSLIYYAFWVKLIIFILSLGFYFILLSKRRIYARLESLKEVSFKSRVGSSAADLG